MYKVKNKYNKKVYSEVMKKYKIKENSILIIPYANTVSNINIKLWIKLVEKLKQFGYVVYTNIGNPRTEKPICGTEGLNLSFDELFNSTVAFRNIVSIRCGLAEYVALSNSKLIVLNDSIKNYDRWDDINVYSKDNLVKNLYLDNKKIDKIIDEIIEEV